MAEVNVQGAGGGIEIWSSTDTTEKQHVHVLWPNGELKYYGSFEMDSNADHENFAAPVGCPPGTATVTVMWGNPQQSLVFSGGGGRITAKDNDTNGAWGDAELNLV